MKVILLVALLVQLIAALAPLNGINHPTAIKDQYIVVLHKNSTLEIRDYHVQSLEVRLAKRQQGEKILASFQIGDFIGFSAVFSKDILEEQLSHSNVQYVDADQIVSIVDDEPMDDVHSQPGATWGLDRVDQRYLPLDGTLNYWASAGAGVDSYIIDTGVLHTHVEYAGRSTHGGNFVGDGSTTDCNGHGTHVAGTVAGTTYGLAKKSNVIGVIVLGCSGSGTWTGVISGVQFVASEHTRKKGRSVANMSLGGGAIQSVDDAVRAAIAAGVHFAIAGGNSNTDACNSSPARVLEALTAGATTSADARASFSNYGNCVDIYGPGQSITSAWIGSNTAISTISGTSMASPHVAGVAVLHAGHLPNNISPKEMHDWVVRIATPDVVTGIPGNNPGYNRFLFSPITDM